jgi:hypothetical protein
MPSRCEPRWLPVVQVYKTIVDYQGGQYPHFAYEAERKIYPVIVTLENWRMFGPAMLDRLWSSVGSSHAVDVGL